MSYGNSPSPVYLFAVWAAIVAGSSSAADWPTWRHDNRRSGITSERLSPPLSLNWEFRSPFPPAKGWARPVNGYGATKDASNVSFDSVFHVTSVDGTAYFASSAENMVYAVDAAEGSLRWTFFTDAPPRLAPTVSNGKVYFGADDGIAYCLDAADGSLVWRVNAAPTDEKMLGTGRFISLWPIRSGVMVEDGVAYFTAGLFPSEGIYFFAVDAERGETIWRRQLDNGGLECPSPQGYLLASSDSIYMTSRVAPTRWSIDDGSRIPFQTPIPHHEYRFHNGGSYAQLWGENIVYGQAAILAYDPNRVLIDKYNRPQNGAMLFNWFNARRVLFNDDLAYLATDYHLLAVEQDRLTELAQAECKQFEEAYKRHRVASYLTALEALAEHGEDSPVGRHLKQTSLKWGHENYQQWPAVAEKLFDEMSKKCRWMTRLKVTQSMIMAADVIYAGGDDEVVALDAAGGKQLWRDQTQGKVRGLAVADGRLFVSTTDGSVRCYDRGPAEAKPKQVPGRTEQEPYANQAGADQYAGIAEQIVNDSKIDKGYCLILAGGTGRLAHEIAKRTKLNVHVLEEDAAKVRRGREILSQAGLYGGRISLEQSNSRRLPFPPYVFNLVVDEGAISGGTPTVSADEILRVTRPCGGLAYLELKQGSLVKLARDRLIGSADWTHNYATAANTYSSEDTLVEGPFGILWYGEPGPRDRIERHAAGPLPLVVDGIMFLTGYDSVMAYDVYNGVRYWHRTILGATRTGLPMGTSNLVADRDGLFVVIGDQQCLQLDAKTGRTVRTYPAPTKPEAEHNFWGWIAKSGELLYGSRSEFDPRRREANPKTSQAVFALNIESGRLEWMYEGQGIEHDGIAIGDGKLFLVDRNLSEVERQEAIRQTVKDNSVEDRPAVDRKGLPVPPDLRKLVVLDAVSGKPIWRKPLNLTDVTLDDAVVSGGRVGVACMYKDGVLVVHGTASLGHPYQEFVKGEFKRRAIYAFSSESGEYLWGGRKNYRKRPIIVGDHVYAEPRAWHLKTGRPKTYVHPVSGRREEFDFFRGYIGCSHLLGSASALFGNKSGIAHLNLDQNCGYTPFGNMSLACGLGAVPANGVFAAPEGRSGCTCDTPIFTSVVLYPRDKARSWSLGVPAGTSAPRLTPVEQVAINLGAPGFREDDLKTLWLPYPARDVGGLLGDWLPTYQHNPAMCYRHSEDRLPISGTNIPWVYTSGYANAKPLAFTLLDQGQEAADYTVRLHFAEPEELKEGERLFDVLLQGKKVLGNFDVVRAAGGPGRALIKVFTGVRVEGELVVTLEPRESSQEKNPILCGIEAVRE